MSFSSYDYHSHHYNDSPSMMMNEEFDDEPLSWWRFLQQEQDKSSYSKDPSELDYSVLSVAVMTLGLIIVLEVGKHYLDQSSKGKPFVTALLDGVYEECAYLCASIALFATVVSVFYASWLT